MVRVVTFVFCEMIDVHTSYNYREYTETVPSYSAGANVSIQAYGLSSDTEYTFACYASNVVGDGVTSNEIKVRTSELPHMTMCI